MTPAATDHAPLYPPTVPPVTQPRHLIFGIAGIVQNPIRIYPEQLYTDEIVPRTFFGSSLVWVTSPRLVEQILLTDTALFAKSPWEARVLGPMLGNGVLTAMGPSWRWQRKATAPLFRHTDVLAYVPRIVDAAETQLAHWRLRQQQHPSTPVLADVEMAMRDATFDVIASTILAGITAEEAQTVKHNDHAYISRITWEFAAIVLRLPPWVWHPAKAQMKAAATKLRAAMEAIVSRRRAEIEAGSPADDVVGRLLAARHPETGEAMPVEMIVNNLATFLEAGHQTTAQALTWTLYLLARAPHWQERLRNEARAVAGDGPVLPEHIERLSETARVFKESMRLYPPVATIVRIATADTELAGQPVRKGSVVIIPLFALHRHRAKWVDPDRFDPDRFLPEREARFERGQYAPFGFGPRTCLGMPLAMVEGLAILATLLRRARFEWDGRHLPEPVSAIVLRPKGGMPLKVSMLP